jgi:hypothetical protein
MWGFVPWLLMQPLVFFVADFSRCIWHGYSAIPLPSVGSVCPFKKEMAGILAQHFLGAIPACSWSV